MPVSLSGRFSSIIAILGILAAAIAAGSGSFTSGTQNEGNSTKASALVQIGENLKVGMDRILLDNGVDLNNVVIGVNNTSNTTDLFSPSGGGIAVPSSSLSAIAANDIWYYPTASIPQMGTNAEDRMAVLQVPKASAIRLMLRPTRPISKSPIMMAAPSAIRPPTTISAICL